MATEKVEYGLANISSSLLSKDIVDIHLLELNCGWVEPYV